MTGHEQTTTVGELPNTTVEDSSVPAVLTRLVWTLWVLSLGVVVLRFVSEGAWELAGVVAVDGLTVLMWTTVTFFSGIVHSYSRRYMAGSEGMTEFFARVFAFTLVVMVLVGANHVVLFGAAWLAMGLVMASLIGHVENWPQAQAAASLSRRYFLASSGLIGVALATLWYQTGATTVSGIAAAIGTAPPLVVLFAAGALLLAAMVQSALVPFQSWLLASMTAPTPASALMHAGFVNAGGILLLRFGPVVTFDPGFMLLIVAAGATSALLGKLLKTVQTDVKRQLGCSTVGQMGFMIMQAGLGFFSAAITHLILHGFYKAYQFLSAGSEVEHTHPETGHERDSAGTLGAVVIVLTALAGGGVFALLTGKGLALDSGLLLAMIVTLTTLHAARDAVTKTSLPVTLRYSAVPLVFLPAIAVYAVFYRSISALLHDLPAVGATAELTVVHGVVGAAFVLAYVAIETGAHRQSKRLYMLLLNATQPSSDVVLTATEEYNDY